MNKRGSALVLAIWIIAVLGIIILNFASETKLQTGINRYMSERVHVDNLTQTGIVIAETILLNYENVKEETDDEDEEELLKENRWLWEERDLKLGSLKTQPIHVDWKNPEGGTVTIEINAAGSDSSKWNINRLCSSVDQNYRDMWERILEVANVPEEYWDELICSWNDWRDEDDAVTSYDHAEGGEKSYYKDEELGYAPRNGEIIDLKELAMIKGFRDFPAVLTGGVINPDDRKEDQVTVTSLLKFFSVYGSGKINVNAASRDVLLTVPGIDMDEEIVDAILEARDTEISREENKQLADEDKYGPFKSWEDLQKRTSSVIGTEAQQYLTFGPDNYFDITVTGTKDRISHQIRAMAIVEDKMVKYIKWQEDP